jgi:hypothetical protein
VGADEHRAHPLDAGIRAGNMTIVDSLDDD